jgi:hypothetical protein
MVPPSWERAVNSDAAAPALPWHGRATQADTMDIDPTDLLRLENAGWMSLCDGSGGEFYGDLLTEDGLMVLADGAVYDRDAVVAALADAPAWSAYEISDEQFVPLGSDAAAFVYRARAFRASGGPAFDAAISSVYVHDDGRWRLALFQQTPVPEEESAEL